MYSLRNAPPTSSPIVSSRRVREVKPLSPPLISNNNAAQPTTSPAEKSLRTWATTLESRLETAKEEILRHKVSYI